MNVRRRGAASHTVAVSIEAILALEFGFSIEAIVTAGTAAAAAGVSARAVVFEVHVRLHAPDAASGVLGARRGSARRCVG